MSATKIGILFQSIKKTRYYYFYVVTKKYDYPQSYHHFFHFLIKFIGNNLEMSVKMTIFVPYL